jgi:hypothetical protein
VVVVPESLVTSDSPVVGFAVVDVPSVVVVDVESEVAESVPVPEGSVVDVVAVSLFEPAEPSVVDESVAVAVAVAVAESLSEPLAESSPLQPAIKARAKAADASPEKGRSRQVIA